MVLRAEALRLLQAPNRLDILRAATKRLHEALANAVHNVNASSQFKFRKGGDPLSPVIHIYTVPRT
jgi:hypothetical protein